MKPKHGLLISGTGAHSLGAECIIDLQEQLPNLSIISLDRDLQEPYHHSRPIEHIRLDLNPFSHTTYHALSTTLRTAIDRAISSLEISGIATAVMSAGCYDDTSLLQTTTINREHILGVNICGKVELLHSILHANERTCFSNSDGLSVIDIGSRHGLFPSNNRTLYSSSKAFGIDLCRSLQDSAEIKRAIYVAPGPVDTQMLHRNYWINKEGGSRPFYDFMIRQPVELYRAVFVDCELESLRLAAERGSFSPEPLENALEKYRERRRVQLATREGILTPEALAHWITEAIRSENEFCAGAYEIVCPNGRILTQYVPFSRVRPDKYS